LGKARKEKRMGVWETDIFLYNGINESKNFQKIWAIIEFVKFGG